MDWAEDPPGHLFISDPSETNDYIVFVHGWNMTSEKSSSYGDTMFKRLWHQGYRGRYATFRWPTLTGIQTYNNSDYRAYKAGLSFKKFVSQLPKNYQKRLVAHSMGNIVVSSAIEQGLNVSHYAMLNAAVPAMCYDSRQDIQLWRDAYDTPDEAPDDQTRMLGFSGIFEEFNTKLINFFLTDDFALDIYEHNNRYEKPDTLIAGNNNLDACYEYDSGRSPGSKLMLRYHVAGIAREVTTLHEARAFVTQSLTLAVGAEGQTQGSVDSLVDLDADYGFDRIHSAQWVLPIQSTFEFYSELRKQFDITLP